MIRFFHPRVAIFLTAAALLAGLGGCAPLVVGGAAVGAGMVATDRRTSGAQVDDQTIEVRAAAVVRDIANDNMYVSVTSYNRQVLLTGSVGSEADKGKVGEAVARVENVRSVVNETNVGPPANFQTRTNDTAITALVKTSLVNTKDIFANSFKVVTERNTVYLLGLATLAETERATQIVRGVSGVEKVVRVVEIIPANAAGGGAAPGGTGSVPLPPMAPLPPANGDPVPVGGAGGGAVTSPVR